MKPSAEEAKELCALYARLMDGWNRADGGAFAEPLTEDADFVAFDGSYFRGRQAVQDFHGPLFKTHLKGSQLVGQVTGVRLLSPTVALIHARGNTLLRGQKTPSAARDSIQTLVATRDEGSVWHLAAFQNTRFRPMGASGGNTALWLLGDWFWNWLGRSDGRH